MYTPDRWIIIKVKSSGGTHYRVFATWHGDYLNGDSWRMNSGIESVLSNDEYYVFEGTSGSEYKCYKDSYGTSGWTASTLYTLTEDAKAQHVTVTVMEDCNWEEFNFERT